MTGPTETDWTAANTALRDHEAAKQAVEVAADGLYSRVCGLVEKGARPSEVAHRLGVKDEWVRWVLREKRSTT